MADEKKKKPSLSDVILGKNKGLIGTYDEAPGGGTPLAKGEKAPSDEWVAAHRKMQPRDENGQFTYNAANAKPLEYGPSRGKTLPPFLEGVKLTYAINKKSVFIGEDDKRYLAGVEMTRAEIIDNFKNWKEKEGGFRGLEKEVTVKTGRKSKVEVTAIDEEKIGLLKGLDKDMAEVITTEGDKLKRYKGLVRVFTKPKAPTTTATPTKPTEVKKPTPAPAPAPKAEPKAEGDFDANLAQTDPETFIEQHTKEIGEIIDLVKSTGIDVTASQVVSAIASGSIKSLAHARELAEDIEEDEE